MLVHLMFEQSKQLHAQKSQHVRSCVWTYLCLATSGSRTRHSGRWGQWRKHSVQAHILKTQMGLFRTLNVLNCTWDYCYDAVIVKPETAPCLSLLNTADRPRSRNSFTEFSSGSPLRSCSSQTRWEWVCGEGGREEWGGSRHGDGGSGDSGCSSGNKVLR